MLKLKVIATRVFSLAIFILFSAALLEDEIKLPQTEKIIFGGNTNYPSFRIGKKRLSCIFEQVVTIMDMLRLSDRK